MYEKLADRSSACCLLDSNQVVISISAHVENVRVVGVIEIISYGQKGSLLSHMV